MFRGLVTALRTLTVLPVPGKEADRLSSSLPWFPCVGILLGAIVFTIGTAIARLTGGWAQGAACVVTIAGVLLTRGLHMDGLADWADGFWGARDREKALRIMKDPAIGSFGAAALICVFLTKWAAAAALLEQDFSLWIIAAYIISRTVQVYLAVALPYARAEGGTAAAFVQGARPLHFAGALALAAAALYLTFGFELLWVSALLAGLLTAVLFGAWCRRRVGGVTGDLLGACSELTETLVLAIGAISAWRSSPYASF